MFTEPNIRYLRGGWQLAPGEALVIEGEVVPCRYWNVLLYSRFLNSLDHRWRPVSRTGATATVADGRYRLVLAAEDPGPGHGDWLDTEGRPFGIVVVRFLQPDAGAHAARRPASWRSTTCAVGDDRLATRPAHRGRAGAVRGRRRRPRWPGRSGTASASRSPTTSSSGRRSGRGPAELGDAGDWRPGLEAYLGSAGEDGRLNALGARMVQDTAVGKLRARVAMDAHLRRPPRRRRSGRSPRRS